MVLYNLDVSQVNPATEDLEDLNYMPIPPPTLVRHSPWPVQLLRHPQARSMTLVFARISNAAQQYLKALNDSKFEEHIDWKIRDNCKNHLQGNNLIYGLVEDGPCFTVDEDSSKRRPVPCNSANVVKITGLYPQTSDNVHVFHTATRFMCAWSDYEVGLRPLANRRRGSSENIMNMTIGNALTSMDAFEASSSMTQREGT